METFSINRESLKTYWMDYEAYRAWQKAKIEYYSKCTLSDKEYEELDRTTFIMRRNEIDRQNLQKKLEEERELNSGDDEQ